MLAHTEDKLGDLSLGVTPKIILGRHVSMERVAVHAAKQRQQATIQPSYLRRKLWELESLVDGVCVCSKDSILQA